MPQSPSSMGVFDTCPRQYLAKYVTKTVQFKPTEATLEGDEFHRTAHKRLALGADTPPKYAGFEPVFKIVERWPGLETELQLAVDNEFRATNWRQRLVGGAIDVLSKNGTKAKVIDWKTGKPREDLTQLMINAVTVFAHYPDVQEVLVGFAYTKDQSIGSATRFSRDKLETIENALNRKIIRIRAAHETAKFPPKQSGLCKQWCDVTECEYNGRREL